MSGYIDLSGVDIADHIRGLDIVTLQQIALKNGIVILDYRDKSILQDEFPNLSDESVPAVLAQLSTMTGDWDDCIDSDRTTEIIKEAAEAADIELDPTQFINHYKCPECGHEWEDEWSAMCDDDCPKCGERHISPHHSEEAPGE